MILTRFIILKQLKKIKKYLEMQKKLGKKSIIFKTAKFYCRSNSIKINYRQKINFLNLKNIEFVYDDKYRHWAETDNITIWLNKYKSFTEDLLYYTLLHEYLHGIILRDNRHFISEKKEHDIMKLIDRQLI
tara:strand:+ start:4034 stop:4426 length:393 start_codon:yes stop_codon:yes gene_type:complete